MDVRSLYKQKPETDHDGSVTVWWLVREGELKKETQGGFLELVAAFEVPVGGKAQPHSHPTHEFYYVTSGRGILMIEDEEREVSDGDFVNIPPNLIHSLRPAAGVPIRAIAFAIAGTGRD
jgi:quercetin dioxygenase-like cupin family protein